MLYFARSRKCPTVRFEYQVSANGETSWLYSMGHTGIRSSISSKAERWVNSVATPVERFFCNCRRYVPKGSGLLIGHFYWQKFLTTAGHTRQRLCFTKPLCRRSKTRNRLLARPFWAQKHRNSHQLICRSTVLRQRTVLLHFLLYVPGSLNLPEPPA